MILTPFPPPYEWKAIDACGWIWYQSRRGAPWVMFRMACAEELAWLWEAE